MAMDDFCSAASLSHNIYSACVPCYIWIWTRICFIQWVIVSFCICHRIWVQTLRKSCTLCRDSSACPCLAKERQGRLSGFWRIQGNHRAYCRDAQYSETKCLCKHNLAQGEICKPPGFVLLWYPEIKYKVWSTSFRTAGTCLTNLCPCLDQTWRC